MTSRAAYLLERLADVRRGKADRWQYEDVQDVGLEVAEFIRDALNVPSLERELVSRAQIDTETLREATRLFESLGAESPPPYSLRIGSSGPEVDWRGRLETLKNVVGGLTSAERLEDLEVLLRLSFAADGALETLLVTLPIDHAVKVEVEALVRKKLDMLSAEKAMEFWAGLRFQVDPSRETHYDLDESVVSASFFDLGDATDVRDRTAKYLAVVRPALERKMIERGVERFPSGLAGVATILSWTSEPSTTEWAATERATIRSLGRIAALWRGDRENLAKTLGVLREGYFLGGRGEQEAKRSLESDTVEDSLRSVRLLDEFGKLVRIGEMRRNVVPGTVERALRAFKLGLEVTVEDSFTDLRKRDELRLQRQLLRFLIERDIPAYGTKFGRSEVDVRADDPLGAIVVETKVLTTSLSEPTLNRWLTQLGSYMDEAHVALRGALVIFNFGAAPILCPVMPLRFRYLLVAINLCGPTPSKRKAAVEIEEAPAGPEIVRVLRLGEVQTLRAQGRRRSSRRQ